MLSAEDRLSAIDLLLLAKSMLRRTTALLEEAAHRGLRDSILRQYNDWVYAHDMIYQFLHREGLYPAHHVERLIQQNLEWAKEALEA
ncbi:MAG: spore coat protein [Hydrogenibacillus sp.]|nr:spore coat protein [Hydrogenibacillus sp.]